MINCHKYFGLSLIILLPVFLFAQQHDEHVLWYRQPAKEWVEALPVGNGAMGAMVFGGNRVERIQVNEESIWSGKPEPVLLRPDYAEQKKKVRDLLFAGKHDEAEKLVEDLKSQQYTGSDAIRLNGVTATEHRYETAGDIFLYFDAAPAQEKNYRRQLDLRTAIATTAYQRAGVNYKEEVFCSYPDKVLVIKLEADSSNALGVLIKPDRPVTAEEEIGNFVAPPTNLKNVYPPGFQAVGKDHFIMRGRASNEGVSFETHLRIVTNGVLDAQEGGIKVSNASYVTVYVNINSDYYGADPGARANAILDKAVRKGYDSIRADHIRDYGSLYNRMEIDLGKGNTQYPLDVRIRNVRNDNDDNRTPRGLLPDPGLLALFYQFNRYMMIASSRPDTLPPALQFWNPSLYPAWYGRPTININQQMNYWPAEVANLSECHLTMLNMLERFLPVEEEIAQKAYHCNGAVLPGRGISLHGPEFLYDTWNDAGAWFGAHFYDHYRFTGDRTYLKEHAYPYMKEMALFYLDFLTMHPDSGYLVTGPSYSPENRYLIGKNIYNYANGVTISTAIIHEILGSTLEAARILNIDSAFRDKIKKVIPRLAPYKISKRYGILQEWDDDLVETEPGHRHLSNLYSVYPGYDITEGSGPLYIAARNVLNRRLDYGSGWTGWSRAWIACLAARFKDGKLAGEQIDKIARSLVFPNFMTTNKRGGHDVYTMDGNFGSLAAMSEMLLQSHQGFIELLPALPPNWESGYIKGLCSRGGFVIDIYWEKGELTKAVIQSKAGSECNIRYKGKLYPQKIAKGKGITFYPGMALQGKAQDTASGAYRIALRGTSFALTGKDGSSGTYEGKFTVLYSAADPQKQLRRGDFGYKKRTNETETLMYNIPTWGKAEKFTVDTTVHIEDGSNPLVDRGFGAGRTANYFSAGTAMTVLASGATMKGNIVEWVFPENDTFSISARVVLGEGAYPKIELSMTPKIKGWYSAGYTGAPAFDIRDCQEIWQPLIWQELRFPNLPYLSEAFRCPIPTTFVTHDHVTIGIAADPAAIPFDPIPNTDNSNFGVLVRNARGNAQPMLFAPVLGNKNSNMNAGDAYHFTMYIFQEKTDIVTSYERLARTLFGFRDHSYNTAVNLNTTIANMTAYCMSPYAMFIDSLRGSSYATDVPGAVKNISGLHPLSVAIVSDDERIYKQRARPMLEYGLSRERFLFTTNPAVKGQGTSNRLHGPGVPLSDLSTTYSVSGNRMPFILDEALKIYNLREDHILNLDATSYAVTWQNALYLYRATKDNAWLDLAKRGADDYLKTRVDLRQTDFNADTLSQGMFFWTSFTNQYMELYLLFKTTGDKRYLDAAWDGARHFAQFCWLTPVIPDGKVVVNKGGIVPRYRTGDKYKDMKMPEESVDAWRVSEIGLTAESSATSSGHRAIFMANHAPFLMRIAADKNDSFLHDIARSAVVGRYASFPGYHINAGRTTAFEKKDFAERSLPELNAVTSLHYNHPWSHVAMLYDYLLADVYYVSKKAIDFPVEYAEGYAYCRSFVFGVEPGKFYNEANVRLFMPKDIVTVSNVQANYITGYGNGKLYVALVNQGRNKEQVTVRFNEEKTGLLKDKKYTATLWKDNKPAGTAQIVNGEITLDLSPEGITALAIDGVSVRPVFQKKILSQGDKAWSQDHATTGFENDKAVLFNFGDSLLSAYVWMEADSQKYPSATLEYAIDGKWSSMTKTGYPYDFTIELPDHATRFEYRFVAVTPTGGKVTSGTGLLKK